MVSAIGTALVYGLGGYFVITDVFTVGTIVAFGSYLGQLYGSLQGLAGAPVEFSTSMVSFERVFEVIDLPTDIPEKEDAFELRDVSGELEFDNVTFNYSVDESKLLKDVKRYGRMDDVEAVLHWQNRPQTMGKRRRRSGNGTRGPSSHRHCQRATVLGPKETDLTHPKLIPLHPRRARSLWKESPLARILEAGRAGWPFRRRQNDDDLSHPKIV